MRARLPLPTWVRGYQRGWLRGDLLAGVTITAYLIPQVMAYAELAGLPAEAGLWACVGALLVYGLLGSSRTLSVGPESTTALMTAAAIGSVPGATDDPESFAAALALAVAAVCLVGWFARASVLAELFSRPVLVGYMAGIAAIMVVSQLGKLTAIDVEAEGFFQELVYVVRHLDEIHLPTFALGCTTAAAMLLASAYFPRAPVALLGMLGATAAAALLGLESHGVQLVGDIPAGVPTPGLPDVDVGTVAALLAPALGVAFVGYTDNVLTARAFASKRGEVVDPRRELLALGAANVGSGLMHGFPVSSSGSRTAIGHAVGGQTQLTAYTTVVATVVAVLVARPLLEAFPAAALGAVVVYAATKLVDVAEFRRLAAFRRSELVLALATTAAVLTVGVLWGVLVAVALSVLNLLRRVAHPHDAVLGEVPGLAGMHDVDDYPSAELVPGLLVYRYDSPLFFANAEDFRTRALSAVADSAAPVEWFVLNTEAIIEVDITAVDALESLRAELSARGIVFAMARVKQDLLSDLEPSGLPDRIGRDRLFPTLPTAVEAFLESR
ncbi:MULTISPECIES: SulP family inorganic anion transporter [unclassified Nocardioides]|uniref:SulP family inorganic anion transporter n=1 Tax=unclassified Nocardioides TaxID=2615069 RepID=UPI003617DB81